MPEKSNTVSMNRHRYKCLHISRCTGFLKAWEIFEVVMYCRASHSTDLHSKLSTSCLVWDFRSLDTPLTGRVVGVHEQFLANFCHSKQDQEI